MGRIKALRMIFLFLGLCLCIACFSSISSAEQQPEAIGQIPAAVEEGLALIKSDLESVIVELRTPSYQTEEVSVDGVAYHLLTVAGYGQTVDAGKPQLPVKGTLLGIPPEAGLSLHVLEVEEEIVAERYNIHPVPEPAVEYDQEGNPSHVGLKFARDESTYSSDVFYPASVAEVGSTAFIRDQRVVELRFFPFQYNPSSGELRQYRRIRVELRFSYPHGGPQLRESSQGGEPFKQVLENSLLNYESATNWQRRPSPTFSGAEAAEQSPTSYKVLVDEDGIYQLTYDALAGEGIDVESIDPGTFKLHNQGDELAILMVDENDNGDFDSGDHILFFGQQMTTLYTDTNVYWLTWGGSPGLRMQERYGTLQGAPVVTSFQTTSGWKEYAGYIPWIPKPAIIPSEEEIDHWIGGYVAKGGPTSESYSIVLDNLALSSPPYSSTVRGYLHGYTYDDYVYPDHHTLIYLNGHLLEDLEEYWDGEVPYEFETEVPDSWLVEGNNTISVECVGDLASNDIVVNQWFEIDYRRTYSVENDSLLFDGDEGGIWQYEVGEFLTDTIEVFDITDPLSLTRIVSTTTVEGPDGYTVRFEDTIGGEHHYLALTEAQYQTPLDIVEYTPAGLKNTSNGADYIIITHPDFHDAVLPLRDHRAAAGLRTAVVIVDDIYDEFSYGIFDPRAIRDFLDYAYHQWRGPEGQDPAPTYVLLVGDGNMDFKDHRGLGEPNYVPPYLIYADPWMGETAADNRYGCVSGEDILPDMHLGRLPAQTVPQVSAMVNKIISYEQSVPAGEWQQQVLFVADDFDIDAGDFAALSDDIADNYLPAPPLYTAEKVYYGIPPYTTAGAVKDAILDAFGSGRLFINYVGHASPIRWGLADDFLEVSDVDSLPESDKMPMILPMACLEGYFIENRWPTLGESLVRVGGKGAVASWSPTSLGESAGHHYLHQGFYEAMFGKAVHQIGPATLLGKLNLYENALGGYRELIDTYVLFGDPAMRLPIKYALFWPLVLKGY